MSFIKLYPVGGAAQRSGLSLVLKWCFQEGSQSDGGMVVTLINNKYIGGIILLLKGEYGWWFSPPKLSRLHERRCQKHPPPPKVASTSVLTLPCVSKKKHAIMSSDPSGRITAITTLVKITTPPHLHISSSSQQQCFGRHCFMPHNGSMIRSPPTPPPPIIEAVYLIYTAASRIRKRDTACHWKNGGTSSHL